MINKIKKELSFIIDVLHECDYFIAGGAIRDICQGEKYKDIDIYFKSSIDGIKVKEALLSEGAVILGETSFVCDISFRGEIVQLVFGRTISNLNEFKNVFDFSVCCAAIDGKLNLVFNEFFIEDLRERNLRLVNVFFSFGTLKRLVRFMSIKYSINDEEIQKLAILINKESEDKLIKKDYL